jgi:hypothetical protein
MTALRYIDLVLLWLTVPLALALGAPQFGVLLAAVVWTVQKIVMLQVDRVARSRETARAAIGLNVATMFGRMWLLAAAIIVAGVAAEREDGVAAALVMLGAFTVSFVTTLLMRSLDRADSHPGTAKPA